MSGESTRYPVATGHRSAGSIDGADLGTVLDALADPDCRRVLRAVGDVALTADECVRACDVPLSTTYRKLGLLEEAGLVAEQLRVRRDGKHASEYRRCFERVRITVDDDGALDVAVSPARAGDPGPPGARDR